MPLLGWCWTRTMDARPMKPFFIEIQNFLGLGRQIGLINSGAFGVFLAELSASILVQCTAVSPLPMFSIISPLFLQKTKPLYPHPKYLFGIEI